MKRLTSREAAQRLSGDEGHAPDDLVLHKARRLDAVQRGDLIMFERPSCVALVGQGYRIYLWRDAWCITGDLDEMEDRDLFHLIGKDILEFQRFLEERSAA